MISRYQIQDQISQGGVGVVYRAWDHRLQRTVAIKRFLAPELRSDGGAIDPDLMREATVLSAVQHPNIVSIYDVVPEGPDGPGVVMEYLNGKDLEHAVAEAAITLDDFYKVAEQTLDALGTAHRLHLLHRDIKPANIQITWLANGVFVTKFVDFGLARFFEKPSKQTVRPDGTVMGSVYYMAPEQLERRPLDGRTDLYSLGCVFYYLLSMHRPFNGETMQAVIAAHLAGHYPPLAGYRPQLPPALCRWIAWLMQRHPEHRPVHAAHAAQILRQIQRGETPVIPLPALPPASAAAPVSPAPPALARCPETGRASAPLPPIPDTRNFPHAGALSRSGNVPFPGSPAPGRTPVSEPVRAVVPPQPALFPRTGGPESSGPVFGTRGRRSPAPSRRSRLRWLVPLLGSAAVLAAGLPVWLQSPPSLQAAQAATADAVLSSGRPPATSGSSAGHPSAVAPPEAPAAAARSGPVVMSESLRPGTSR